MFDLEDDFFDYAPEDVNHCYVPIFRMPEPNAKDVKKEDKLDWLERQRYTWYLGAMFFDKYFMVFDNQANADAD